MPRDLNSTKRGGRKKKILGDIPDYAHFIRNCYFRVAAEVNTMLKNI